MSRQALDRLAQEVQYEPHPHHKRYPRSCGLAEPRPRLEKAQCDVHPYNVSQQAEARRLLLTGIRAGLISKSKDADGYPRRIWSVCEKNGSLLVFEAIQGSGISYHGYPLDRDDDAECRRKVLAAWQELS